MIEVRNNWISKIIAAKDDTVLLSVFEEITDFRNTGLLNGNLLREIESEIAETTHTNGGEMMRYVEDAVLYEISRRYYNSQKSDTD